MKARVWVLCSCLVSVLSGTPVNAQDVCGSGADLLQARAFVTGAWRILPVNLGGPSLCLRFEPVGDSYANDEVDLNSIVLTSAGTGSVTSISCIPPKTAVEADMDANGIQELPAWFSSTDLALLFDRAKGRVEVTATLTGRLVDGSSFCGPASLTLIHPKHHPRSLVTPNPLHGNGVLRIMAGSAGTLRVRIYDLQGRLVRTLARRTGVPGTHEVQVDARDEAGSPLGSGVYFYVAETGDGTVRGRFAVMK